MRLPVHFCLTLIVVDVSLALIENITNIEDIKNDLRNVETRRKGRHRSTSSSSGDIRNDDKSDGGGKTDSLELSVSSSSESQEKKNLKSTKERTGWRKWHRKCPPCPEDMVKKWNDRTIKWICGGYQRARRSFKSSCMMHYRNCQDGTMFVKIHDLRCSDSNDVSPHGIHFFYDYKVPSGSSSSDSSESKTVSDSSSE